MAAKQREVWVIQDEKMRRPITDDYDLGASIGQPGQYGRAVCGTKKHPGPDDPEEFVIKIISKSRFIRSRNQAYVDQTIKAFRAEVDIMAQMDHPGIIKYYGAYEDKLNFYIVMEKCGGGELFDRISSKQRYRERDAANIMRQLFEAIDYMHRVKKVCHNDLKPDNCIFLGASDDNLKLIDFGMSKRLPPPTADQEEKYFRDVAGTPYYMAPEVIERKYNNSADVWSLGVVMFVMLHGYPPFYADPAKYGDEQANKMIYQMIQTKGFDPSIKRGFKNHFPEKIPISREARDLISKILVKDVSKRPTAEEVLEHPWIQGKVDNDIAPGVIKSLQQFYRANKFKLGVLNIMTDSLTEDDMRALQKSFKKMDANGDGTITLDELREALQGQNMQVDQINQIMQRADLDGDGVISYRELMLTSVHRKLRAKEERLLEAFDKIDVNHDGKITLQEMRGVLDDADFDEAKRLFQEVDKNNDGSVSKREFLDMWMDTEEKRTDDDWLDTPTSQKEIKGGPGSGGKPKSGGLFSCCSSDADNTA